MPGSRVDVQVLDRQAAENLRRSKRETLVTAALLWPVDAGEDDPGTRVFVANISMEGIAFRAHAPYAKGSMHYIRLTAGPLRLESLVRVARCRERENGVYEIGSQFLERPGEPMFPSKKPA